ncbi:MAG: OmpA family protein [Gallionella sp.]
MSYFRKYIAVALATGLLIATSSFAGDSPDEISQRIGTGDPVRGKEASGLCQGCHGADGNSAIGIFPKLSGQWADYIQKQFREFQNGARQDPTMTDMALSVGEFPELFDIAAYFASQNMMIRPVVEDEKELALYREGEKLYNDGNANSGAFRCVMCHGKHGQGEPLNNPLFPILGGQHKDYLIKQLTDFKRNSRDNDRSGMMMLIAGRLSEDNIVALSTYLAIRPAIYETGYTEKNITLEGTNFDVGSAVLKETAFEQLDGVVEYANTYPDVNLNITGHTDITGRLDKNMILSEDRAESVKQFLISNGVAAERIFTQGFGPEIPIASNDTPEGRSKNRRVEIRSKLKESYKFRVN